MERYSLEHVEGIRNEGQRANGVPYLCKMGQKLDITNWRDT